MSKIVNLTTDILNDREKEESEDEDHGEEEDLDELDQALEIKGKTIHLGKYENNEL
jgi:hypothetical protein